MTQMTQIYADCLKICEYPCHLRYPRSNMLINFHFLLKYNRYSPGFKVTDPVAAVVVISEPEK